MGTHRISILSACLLLITQWSPAHGSDKCSLACKGSPSAASFVDGHTYNYAVDGEVAVYLNSADKQQTDVKVSAQVSVGALGNCVLSLKINSLSVSGPDGKKYPAPKGIDKVVKFSFEEGRVGPVICVQEDDHRPSLNIKRAIISLLQTEQKPSTQVDVFGACPTEVSSSQEGSSVLLHRSRDLSRCAHREQIKSELVSAVYNPTAEIKNSQILRSILNVEAKVKNGIPEKVSAIEEYLYRPFSVGENGARAKVNTKLSLSGTAAGVGAAGDCPQSRTIIFENPHDARAEHSSATTVLNAVRETGKSLASGTSPHSAGLFAQLVRIIRSTNKDDLLKVFGQVQGNNLEKRVFVDGLLRAGTGHSIEASINILKSKKLTTFEQNLVLLSLGNAKHVNGDALKSAAGLLDLPDLPKEVYLGVGALAGTYCRDHNCHSDKNEGITMLSKKLVSKLQNCKAKTKIEEDQIIAVLKGIRNIRHLDDSVIDKLVHCALDNGLQSRVRVNALEAFLADPCSAKIKKAALDVLKNRQLDSEIRIKAYLAVIGCPCAKSANEIKNLLSNEPVHQVGRFITTSLQHIRSSANPDRQLARQHYGQIGTPNKFKIDDRKYSFYRELSFNIDALGAGGNLDQTVIYSQDSFLPRSITLNLTTEIFGHSINLLEVGARQGNLDRVLEHFLGPKSFLRTQKPQEIYDNLVKRYDESYNKVERSLRGRRSIKSEIDSMDKQIKSESTPYNSELDLDIFVKLFGTDAIFLSLGDDKGFDFNSFIDKSLKVVNEGLDSFKHFQHELRGHVLFLDAEIAYPTSTGLPLKLDFIGSATGRFDISSAVDIRQILRNPETAKIDIKLVPSTDVEVSLIFLIDADCFSTGLKVINNLQSSTGTHVIAKVIENGHGIDLQFGLPIDKQEILTASNDLVFFTAEEGKPEKIIEIKVDSEKKEYSACFDQLAGVLGLNLCGEISLPFTISGPKAQESISNFLAKYPLVGSSRVKLVLEKNDLRGYHLKGVFRSDAKSGRYGIELLFDAEGSQNRRTQITGDFVNNSEEKTIKVGIDSPIKSIVGQASLYTKANEISLLINGKLDANEYYAKAGLSINGNEKRSILKPVLEYQIPDDKGKRNLKVDGQVIRETNGPSSKYTLQGVKFDLPNSNEAVNLEGHFALEPKSVDLDFKVKQGQQNVLLSGSLKGYDVKVEFQNTLNPYINFKCNGHFENTQGINHNDIEVFYGGDLRNAENSVVFNQLLKYHSKTAEDFNVISKNKFEIRALPLKACLDFEADPNRFDLGIEGGYFDKKALFNVDSRRNIKAAGDYRVKALVVLDKKTVEALFKRDIVSPEKSNLENYIDFKDSSKYELSGVVLHKLNANDISVGAVGHFKITGAGKDEDVKFDIGVIENSNLYSSHASIATKNGQLVDFLLKIARGDNPSGQLKLTLKDAVEANGKFQVTGADGKGNGNIIIHFNKVQRVIKAETKFIVKDPVYNADVELFLNFGKDNNDKIQFSTSNKQTEKLTDSKNKLQYGGKTTEVNVHKDGIIALTGKLHGNVEVVLPTERCLSFKLDREMTEKDNVYNGHLELVISDAEKRGGAASIIKVQNRLTDSNVHTQKMTYEGQTELILKDGKKLVSAYSSKNIPNGDKFDSEFKADISGDLMPKKASIDVTYSYTGDIKNKDDLYRVKLNYGGDISVDVLGKEVTTLPAKGEIKASFDYTASIRLPLEKAHDVKWTSKFLYIQPENHDIEVTLVESLQIDADQYKIESSGKYNVERGSVKLKAVVPRAEPLVLDLDYKLDGKGQKKIGSLDLKSQYGKGKSASVDLKGVYSPQEYELKVRTNTPDSDKLKVLTLDYHIKVPTPDTYQIHAVVDADGRVYKSESVGVFSRSQPVFDTKYSSPTTPDPVRIYLKGADIRSNHALVEVKFENFKYFDLDASAEAGFDKDLILNVRANSQKLGCKNYKIEIASKDSGNGKRLEFSAENENKNILSGSTSFISKQEGPKLIIEGSGTLKVKDEQKPANFKYIRTFLTEGNEQGVETFVNLALGERNHVIESRITNLEYKGSYVYCEEKKQCAHAELTSKLVTNKPGSVQQVSNIVLDLRKLGLPTEFGLQSTSEYSDKKFPQHELNLHVNRDNDKIHLHAYSQPEIGKYPAGITITLPTRVLAAESLIQFPVDKGLPFPIKAEFNLYPDKNKPQSKTAGRFNLDASANDKQGELSAVIGFSHPKLGKEALFKFHGTLRRPNDNTIKIETSAVASHSTLGNDRETKFSLEASPVHVKLLIDTPIVKVIDLEGKAVLKENLQQGDLKFSLLQGKPVTVHAIAKEFKYYELSTGYSDESERKLSVIAHLEPEKRVDISADIILPGQKKNIIHGALFLDNNYVKSDYGISNENFQYFVSALKKDLLTLQSRVREIGDKSSAELKRVLKRVEPTLKQISQAYKEDMEKLAQEITNDTTLKEISEGLHSLLQIVAKIIDDVTNVLKPIAEKVAEAVSEGCKRVNELYEKQIEPQVKELYNNLSRVIGEALDGAIDVVAHFSALVIDFFERHKPELQELANIFTEMFKDITRILVAQLRELREKSSQFINEMMHQIKDLPLVNVIKEKWQELAVPDQILAILTEAKQTVSEILPTEESKSFVDALYNYAQKKLRQEKVDDVAELRNIYEKLIAASTSLVQLIKSQLGQYGVPVHPALSLASLIGPNSLSMPSFGGSASFNLLSQLMRGDLPDPLALVNAYRPRSLNPLDEVPSKMRAVIVNGQHIFTFDGRHLTFPGSCRYVLAIDYVDRNFTLISQLANGSPKSLILEDKSGTTIELKENGQVTLNGAAHGFPVIDKDVFAFKDGNGRVGLGSTYGLMAFCSNKLEVCYIDVSGFYLGKLRGLLGDGNNEPYDDFRLPNGKITSSESEFGNAYRLASSCPQVKTPEHSDHQHHMPLPAACEAVFGGLSPLKPLSLFLDIAPFRQACIHAASGQGEEAIHQACDLARGYAALALTGLLPAVMPPRCVRCEDGDKPREVGEVYEIKLPNKQADIIITVEITKANEKNYKDIVVPLVSHVIDTLKSKRITDVKVFLVGITSKFPYPLFYDTDVKLKGAKVKFDDDSRYDLLETITVNNENIDKLTKTIVDSLNNLRFRLGIFNVETTYKSLLDINLRPGAVKHYLGLVDGECGRMKLMLNALEALPYKIYSDNNAISQSIVYDTPALKMGGGKPANQVVGFTKNSVLLVGDKKLKDSESLRSQLEVPDDDGCISFLYEMDGILFSSTNFRDNAPQQKQFIQTMASSIVNRMLEQSLVQQCTCSYVDPFRVRSVCITKERKEARRKK